MVQAPYSTQHHADGEQCPFPLPLRMFGSSRAVSFTVLQELRAERCTSGIPMQRGIHAFDAYRPVGEQYCGQVE